MAAPTTPEEAFYARLSTGTALAALVQGRITPQLSTQEVGLPCVVFQRTGKEAKNRLNGTSKTGKYTLTATAYADTEAQAHAVSNAVQDRLCPDGGWQDPTAGVQGCFAGDSTEDVTDDGIRLVARPFELVWQPPPPPSSLLTGLAAYWPLDETPGSTRADALGGNPLAEVGGTTGQTTGKIGNCAVFNGTSGQRLENAAPTFETAGRDWTLALWFYFAANPDPAVETTFLAKGDPGGLTTGEIGLSDAFGNLMLRVWSGSGFALDSVSAGPMPAAGAWHLVVCWQDTGAGKIGISLDNAAAVLANRTQSQTASGVPFALGGIATLGGASAAVRLDECAFWTRVLSANERSLVWNNGVGKTYPF